MKRNTRLEFDNKTGVFVRREEIPVGNSKEVREVRESLMIELAGIVRQVKRLKYRAEEIKSMLAVLDEKAGPIDPAPEQLPAQR